MAISERLKDLRKKKGLTQAELAKKVGLSIATIQGYEQGKYEPKYENLCNLAIALDAGILDLVNKEEFKKMEDIRVQEIMQEQLKSGRIRMIENKEMLIIGNYSKLNDVGKNKLLEYSEDLAGNPKYQADK